MKLGTKNPAARGNCYQAAYELLLKHGGLGNPDVVLVHGVVMCARPPHEPMGHAWVEERDPAGMWWVRDGLYPNGRIPAPLYYAVGRVGHTARYKFGTALRAAFDHENYGPWDPVVSAAAHADDENSSQFPLEVRCYSSYTSVGEWGLSPKPIGGVP